MDGKKIQNKIHSQLQVHIPRMGYTFCWKADPQLESQKTSLLSHHMNIEQYYSSLNTKHIEKYSKSQWDVEMTWSWLVCG